MGILPERCITWFCLRKRAICVITFVTLLAISMLYQEGNFLVSPQGPFNSTCSHAADRRGPNQRIIGYSLYGNFSREEHLNRYVLLFKETLKSIPSIYPGKYFQLFALFDDKSKLFS